MPDPESSVPATSLLTVLDGIRSHGAIGEVSLDDAIAHASRFAQALPESVRRLVDLGSGGGLPGLVVATLRPEIEITLVERRRSRADLLARAVRALSLDDHVTVVADDVATVARSHPHSFDAVTARSFAAPAVTARWASMLLVGGGILLVSEPPAADAARWPATLLQDASLHDEGCEQGIRTLRRL